MIDSKEGKNYDITLTSESILPLFQISSLSLLQTLLHHQQQSQECIDQEAQNKIHPSISQYTTVSNCEIEINVRVGICLHPLILTQQEIELQKQSRREQENPCSSDFCDNNKVIHPVPPWLYGRINGCVSPPYILTITGIEEQNLKRHHWMDAFLCVTNNVKSNENHERPNTYEKFHKAIDESCRDEEEKRVLRPKKRWIDFFPKFVFSIQKTEPSDSSSTDDGSYSCDGDSTYDNNQLAIFRAEVYVSKLVSFSIRPQQVDNNPCDSSYDFEYNKEFDSIGGFLYTKENISVTRKENNIVGLWINTSSLFLSIQDIDHLLQPMLSRNKEKDRNEKGYDDSGKLDQFHSLISCHPLVYSLCTYFYDSVYCNTNKKEASFQLMILHEKNVKILYKVYPESEQDKESIKRPNPVIKLYDYEAEIVFPIDDFINSINNENALDCNDKENLYKRMRSFITTQSSAKEEEVIHGRFREAKACDYKKYDECSSSNGKSIYYDHNKSSETVSLPSSFYFPRHECKKQQQGHHELIMNQQQNQIEDMKKKIQHLSSLLSSVEISDQQKDSSHADESSPVVTLSCKAKSDNSTLTVTSNEEYFCGTVLSKLSNSPASFFDRQQRKRFCEKDHDGNNELVDHSGIKEAIKRNIDNLSETVVHIDDDNDEEYIMCMNPTRKTQNLQATKKVSCTVEATPANNIYNVNKYINYKANDSLIRDLEVSFTRIMSFFL